MRWLDILLSALSLMGIGVIIWASAVCLRLSCWNYNFTGVITW